MAYSPARRSPTAEHQMTWKTSQKEGKWMAEWDESIVITEKYYYSVKNSGVAIAYERTRSKYVIILQRSPCICFWGKDSLHKGLRRHPFDWQHSAASFPVIAGSVEKHMPRQKKETLLWMPTVDRNRVKWLINSSRRTESEKARENERHRNCMERHKGETPRVTYARMEFITMFSWSDP